jgi:hypothetical protein
MPINGTENEPGGAHEASNGEETAVTPALVRKVADKVYTMMLLDLRLERERQRISRRRSGCGRGTR